MAIKILRRILRKNVGFLLGMTVACVVLLLLHGSDIISSPKQDAPLLTDLKTRNNIERNEPDSEKHHSLDSDGQNSDHRDYNEVHDLQDPMADREEKKSRDGENADDTRVDYEQLLTKSHQQQQQQQQQPKSRTVLDDSAIKQRFEERRLRLRKACDTYYNNDTGVYRPTNHGWMNMPVYPSVMNVSVRYCPLAKTSTTTWNIFFAAIRDYMEKHGIQGTEDRSNVDDEIMFTFVREPFGRMLSGFVDKLLTPNTLFWRITGRYAVKRFRQNPTQKALKCGHDLTFAEFVKYVVYSQSTGENRNGHFIPTHDQCGFCRHPYRYIGFLETIADDMPYLTKAIRSPISYTRAYDSDTIVQNAKMVLWASKVNDVLKCMTREEAGRRLWKKYQIRGLISKHERFPFPHGGAVNITFDEFVKVALEAHERSLKTEGKEALKGQRKEALREAYASVPLKDRLDVQSHLFLDFQMFGFDPMLEDVFPKSPYVKDQTFSYYNIYDH